MITDIDIKQWINEIQPIPLDKNEIIEACKQFDIDKIDLQGWIGNDHAFQIYIEQIKPKVIIEIGSWKGLSTLIMDQICKKKGLDTKIIAIDTWLGSREHWNIHLNEILHLFKDGFPAGLYYQFLFNIAQHDALKTIIPLRQTSDNAYYFLIDSKVKADIVFIDGAHEREQVYRDLTHYQKFLTSKGIIIGDDISCPEVEIALKQFMSENKNFRVSVMSPFFILTQI